MPSEQSFKHHVSLDPITHFTLIPICFSALILSLYLSWHDWPQHRLDHLWMTAASVALILLNVKSRVYSLAVQDRVIRLEERQRLHGVLPPAQHAVIAQLTNRQLIALRCASDAELPALAVRAATEKLDNKAIKRSIVTWRPDYIRI